MNAEIIATIGEEALVSNFEDIIDKMINLGVDYFRFNLSRYHNEKDFAAHVNMLNKIRLKYGNNISFLIDLPYPNEKIRIFHASEAFRHISKNDCLIVESKNSNVHNKESFVANVDDIDQLITNVNDKIIFADGEITFRCHSVDHCNKSVELIAEQEGIVFSRKAISFGKIIKSQIDLKRILTLILDINPEALALSFVEDVEDVDKLLSIIPKGKDVQIFSKIENVEGIKNVDLISKKSNIIVARGDMLLNTDINEFGLNQVEIINKTKKNGKAVAVATGILPSMASRNIPTQAELIDLYCIKRENVDYLVLNYGLVRSENINKAIELIKAV